MTPTFLGDLAGRHLGGPLPPDFIDLTRPLDDCSDEAKGWFRRAFRAMEREGFRPQDFSSDLALASLRLPATLPEAWLGAPPAITQAGRHHRYDEYVAHNPWRTLEAGDRLLDVGCGFPPLTTLDTARRFPDLEVTGIDPSVARFVVYNDDGDYGVFGSDNVLRFCYVGEASPGRLAIFTRDYREIRARFAAAFERFAPHLPTGPQPMTVVNDGYRLVSQPAASYPEPNAHFVEAGIGADGLGSFAAIRSINVLRYFDRAFGDATRRWVGSLLEPGGIFVHGVNSPAGGNECYFVWQRHEDRLVPREFAIAPRDIRSHGLVSWWTLYDDDPELAMRSDVIGTLWASDPSFRTAFNTGFDSILEQNGYGRRRVDGFFEGPPLATPLAELRRMWTAAEDRLVTDGWVEEAARRIAIGTGRRAWQNSTGDLAVDPTEWAWQSVDL